MAFTEMLFSTDPHAYEGGIIDLLRAGAELLEATLTEARSILASTLFNAYGSAHLLVFVDSLSVVVRF